MPRILQMILMMARQRYHIFGDKDGCSKKSKNPLNARYAAITPQT
jgi:predicted DCC family thiol-disulfide oxidoreductase YuxK